MKQCFCELGLARMEGRAVWVFLILMGLLGVATHSEGKPRRLLLDTDMDTDDLFAILYLLKQNRSLIDLKAITINANAWTNAGHAVNQLYDILYMMNRDDIPVGVGGEGGILEDGTILPNVGGYLPLIEQRNSTFGYCRYRQAIPVDRGGGRLDIDTNYGIRRAFLPQGHRRYSPLSQPTVQQVMTDVISAGPTTVLLIGAHTNFAIFLMTHPHLKKNIEHIYIMGGGVRSKNPTGCCPANASSSCIPQQCGDQGNLFTAYKSNPYAEFNMFGDPFAAYQVIHSGIPITLVPLDATNTIPVTEEFFNTFKGNQNTYEAQYCFQSLNMVHDTWFNNGFYTSYFMWDSFTSGVVVSIISNQKNGQNDFAEMEYINLTVVTSNKPYGIHDGSNPFFDGRTITKFNLNKDGVHSGHVQTEIQDPFCMPENITEKGKCEDGYTKEVNDTEDAVRVLVAEKAKPNKDKASPLEREFFVNFLYALNLPVQSGRFNFSSQFPFYKQIFYKPDLKKRKLGKPVVFDMDMSIGDFISLLYLLKTPAEIIDLKAILVNGNGWANIATIDAIYDILHMMGRDDIPVGLGSVTPLENPSYSCKYVRYIPHGSGGLLDSDTLYGFARNLPRSPRSYTVENSVRYGAPRNTKHPELRQPSALEVWQNVSRKSNLNGRKKITILTNGPLTNVANIIRSNRDASSTIQSIFIVGGHLSKGDNDKGNIFTMPSNKYSEFNFFLDPIAAKAIIEAKLDIKLIPLVVQRNASSFPRILEKLQTSSKTPELTFTQNLLSLMYRLQQENQRYNHMDIFLGEILGAVVLVGDSLLKASMKAMNVSVVVHDITRDGQLVIDDIHGQPVHVLSNLDTEVYYDHIVNTLGNSAQAAVIGSFDEQKIGWSTPPRHTQKIH